MAAFAEAARELATRMSAERLFTTIATRVARAAGRPGTFFACCVIIIVWALSGPAFGFSDTWQLIINTSTTIVTFLMVFLIQNTQNRDGVAIQAKLDELIRVTEASNRLIGIEHLTDSEVEAVRKEEEAARGARREREARSRGKAAYQ